MPAGRPASVLLTACAAMSLWMGLSGCGGGKTKAPAEENPAADHLRKIAQAFDLAIYKGRVPQNVEELKPFLTQLSKEEDADALLVSPNDAQPYEIMWGANLDHQEDINAIFAHEKDGVGGKRYAITVARIVKQISDAEFKDANFAKGKKSRR